MPVKPIPDGYATVTPYLIIRDAARAIEFYKQAFGAEELFRMADPNSGSIAHAEIRIGDSRIMMTDEWPHMDTLSPSSRGGTTVHFYVYVEDVDASYKQALAAGGKELMPLKDQFYGDRTGTITDPYGHIWTIASHKEDLSAEELQQRAEAAMKEGCAGQDG
ncbi:MAG: VOC family protein [bacterium]|jgi:PhnB protein